MSRAGKIVAAIGTLCLALGTGLAVQTTQAAGQDPGTIQPSVAVQSTSSIRPRLDAGDPVAAGTAPNSAPGSWPDGAATLATLHSARHEPTTSIASELPFRPDAPCLIRSGATAEPAAFVRLRVVATCLPASRVTVHHNGLLFTDTTDAHGTLDIVVPALAEHAVFMLTFAGHQMAMAVTQVPDVRNYERVVLQWRGHGGLELHAREFGSDFGSAGHVWHGSGGTDIAPRAGLGGHHMRLGNPDVPAPMIADVYSFPSDLTGADSGIHLSVEAEVTERNCGRDIEAQTIELYDAAQIDVRSIVLTVPACDMVGEHLVLNNVFEDLKIAAR